MSSSHWLNARIDDLLCLMTLDEKTGQMSQIKHEKAHPDVTRKYFISSALSGGGSVPAANAPPETWVKMVNGMQGGALSMRLGIPMLHHLPPQHRPRMHQVTCTVADHCFAKQWSILFLQGTVKKKLRLGLMSLLQV